VRYRLDGSVIASIVIHAVIAAAVLPALIVPHRIAWLFVARTDAASPSERIVYVEAAWRVSVATIPETATVPARLAPAPRRLVSQIVTGTPTARATAGPLSGYRSAGSTTGTDDPGSSTVSLIPSDPDPRVLAPLAAVAPTTPDRAGTARSINRRIALLTDSSVAVAEAIALSERRDWSLELGGARYGIDSTAVHFGRFSIPGLFLGLLPIPAGQVLCLPTGCEMVALKNPGVSERATRIAEMSAEIRSRSSITRDSREEVARIAARKDNQRAARLGGVVRGTPPDRATPPPR
jgi:hypothetical protein